MKLRAFVVMPFGVVQAGTDEHEAPICVDFDKIYHDLLEPALRKADCEPFRADSQISAGDIRTDMFFELVTADLVVADLSIPNPNVYYELGIRDGVCERGVFIVQGGWTATRPFDVASDRSFRYPGKLFVTGNNVDSAETQRKIAEAVFDLAADFATALGFESQATGSPLYAHLPGLKQVDWENIETSKSRYFGVLQRDWEERVRNALALQRPGNILTIAEDAPTRLHRTKILAQAARSLIGLCQFAAAEEVLKEILLLKPDDLESRLQLGIVLASSGQVDRGQNQLQRILDEHETNPTAGLAIGYVYRALWYLQWANTPNPREQAINSSRLLLSAIRSFHDVQRRHPGQYLGGYNALLLFAVLEELFPGIDARPPLVDRSELSIVVRYAATAAREGAEVTGDYDTQFWSAVSLSGLDLLAGNKLAALQGIRDACAVPSATLFYLQSLQERLVLLEKLNFKMDIVADARAIVDATLQAKRHKNIWRKVVVFHGYPIDEPGQSTARFPTGAMASVDQKMDEILAKWSVGKGDLAICAGTSESDILFGEKCVTLGAHVRLLMIEATPGQLAAPFSNAASSRWTTRGYALVECAETEVWYHEAELGRPVDPKYLKGRNNRWMLNTAQMEAENATEDTRLYGLVLWDGSLNVADPEDPSFFIAEIRKANPYKGGIFAINPAAP